MSAQAIGLKGLRVLIVEDEMIVALEIEDVLRAEGCEVVGPIGTLRAAVTVAQTRPLDAAILDVNLHGEWTLPVAEELRRRNIPFILATGYDEAALPAQWRGMPRLAKPFQSEELAHIVGSLIRR